MNVFFTGDTHFGDHRVLNIRPRPFDSLDEMNETLIARWNARVRAEDDIWHLGDFASGLKLAQLVLPKLNGRKHLVPGNNDPEAVCRLEWTSVQRYRRGGGRGHHAGSLSLSIPQLEPDAPWFRELARS
jgi:calcineurin-like phosphoesterase family protein